tara:strand:+ start:693 stop:2852 length:2160 start_codon:yes stop_codon:yes gene_type:complete
MSTQEIKGQLAKLLAAENLVVEHRVCETASFDVDRRVLVLPIWKDLDNDTYDLLVGHEVGHALYTPTTEQEAIPDDLPRSYVNVTEDARIERNMKYKFPGLTKSFYRGYQNLHTRDFFNVQGTDLTKLKLIDRINLHYKIGTYALIPFKDDEQQFVDLVGECETFSDAIAAARVVFDYDKAQRKKDETPAQQTSEGSGRVDTVSSDTEQQGREQEQGDSDAETDQQPSDRDWDDADLDTPSYEAEDVDDGAQTDTALEESLKNHTSKNDYDQPVYIEIHEPKVESVIIDHNDVQKVVETFWSEYTVDDEPREIDFTVADRKYRTFQEQSNREVNYLVKEFECRKSASSYARATTSRTGVLDCSKLHTYKYSEDLFKKVVNTPDGKNHGLVFYLDWSGSMSPILFDTIKQLLSLTSFCRKVGIPFEVYSFVTEPGWDIALGKGDIGEELTDRQHNTYAFHKYFRLVNLLSSRARSSQYEAQARNLFRIGMQFGSRHLTWSELSEHRSIPLPSCLSLGGTPLNDAIAMSSSVYKNFQKMHGVEKLNLVILSDGESNYSGQWVTRLKNQYYSDDYIFFSAMSYRARLRNRKNGRVYPELGEDKQQTIGLLDYVRDTCPGVNIVGFRILPSRDLNRTASNWCNFNIDKIKTVVAQYRKEKAAVIPDCGYNELYLIASQALDNQVEFEVQEEATKQQIRSAFRKTLKSKAANKKILTSFIKQIA